MVFGNFSENYEFAAMKSTGISLQRAMKSLSFFIVFLAIISFFFANNVIPLAEYNFFNLRRNIARVKPAMAISEAWRRCPAAPYGNGIYIRGSRGLYSRASRKVMQILQKPAEYFEQASIDEAYLDVTDFVSGDWDLAVALCRDLQDEIIKEIGLSI